MTSSEILRFIVIIFSFLSISAVPRAEFPVIPEAAVPLVRDEMLDETIRFGLCIILYSESGKYAGSDWNVKGMNELMPLLYVDEVLKETLAFKERIASSVRIYRANTRQLPSAMDQNVHSVFGLSARSTKYPMFITYDVNGAEASRICGPFRPDALTWLVHSIMEYYTHSIETDKGDFLRQGWLVTDTKQPFINVVGVKQGSILFNNRTEEVQIVNYVSTLYEKKDFTFERIYSPSGRLLGSIETYGPFGTFGYFDYDGTGKFQYRVRYLSAEGK